MKWPRVKGSVNAFGGLSSRRNVFEEANGARFVLTWGAADASIIGSQPLRSQRVQMGH